MNWVCKEKELPKKSGFYLIVLDNKYIDLGQFSNKTKMFEARDNNGSFNILTGMLVTHWAELPPLPKGDEND